MTEPMMAPPDVRLRWLVAAAELFVELLLGQRDLEGTVDELGLGGDSCTGGGDEACCSSTSAPARIDSANSSSTSSSLVPRRPRR